MWALNYSSDNLDNITSNMVSFGTRCPKWTYIDKDMTQNCSVYRIMI